MKVIVLGSLGNLGQELTRVLRERRHEVIALDRADLDVTDAAALTNRLLAEAPQLIVNASAWNDVDGAEDPAKRPFAFRLNADAPTTMALAAKEIGAGFVHFSTDYVFDGSSAAGYAENDEPKPLSAYGQSKYLGERSIAGVGGRYFICRTSKLFGPPGQSPASKPSFLATMLRLAKTKPELAIVDEEVGCPTYTADLAEGVVALAEDSASAPGIYHLVNDGPGVTWYGFAEEIFGLLGIKTPRRPVSAAAFPRAAQVPKSAVLRNTKTLPLRPRLEALRSFFAEHPELL